MIIFYMDIYNNNVQGWTIEIEELLEKMRRNAVILSNRHRKNFYEYKGFSKYFDIPIIIVSVFGSSFSVGAVGFISQEIVSLINCFIGMLVTVLTSIKLYLHLDDHLKNELEMSKHFHSLALKLFKILNLPRNQRGTDGLYFLNNKYGDYIKLVEQSSLLRRYIIKDSLLEIPYGFISDDDINTEISDNSWNENNFFYWILTFLKFKKKKEKIKKISHISKKYNNKRMVDNENDNLYIIDKNKDKKDEKKIDNETNNDNENIMYTVF